MKVPSVVGYPQSSTLHPPRIVTVARQNESKDSDTGSPYEVVYTQTCKESGLPRAVRLSVSTRFGRPGSATKVGLSGETPTDSPFTRPYRIKTLSTERPPGLFFRTPTQPPCLPSPLLGPSPKTEVHVRPWTEGRPCEVSLNLRKDRQRYPCSEDEPTKRTRGRRYLDRYGPVGETEHYVGPRPTAPRDRTAGALRSDPSGSSCSFRGTSETLG